MSFRSIKWISILNWQKLKRKCSSTFIRYASISHLCFNNNHYDFEEERKKFKWEIPKHFNFANDVIDNWAHKETIQVRNKDIPAFWFIGVNGQEIKWNFQELASNSKKTANVLKTDCGLGYKDRVMIILPRIPEWWLINIACIRNGIILSPSTTQLRVKDIRFRFEKFKPKVVVADVERAQLIDEIVDKHPCIKYKLLVNYNKEINGWLPFNHLFKQASDDHICMRTISHDPMFVFFTSGTAGNPKMIVQPHIYGLGHFNTGKYMLDVGSSDIVWSLSDTGWVKTAFMSLFGPWSQGSCVFIGEEPIFNAFHVLKILEKWPITVLCLPPTAFRMIVLEDLTKFKFKTLRHCLSGGESLNDEIIRKWKDHTGLDIYKGFGQTETTSLIGFNRHMKYKSGSLGKAMPGYDIRIVDNDGDEVPPGTDGNIAIKIKPQRPVVLFTHYFDEPNKIASCFKKDFYLTGDRGFVDKDGYFWFVGRDDDIIISAGYRIGPYEVESALIEHPAVIESAVVSSPDSVRGEVVKAFIILAQEYLNKDRESLIKDIQEHVKSTTAPYKYPRKIEFVKELPKTISGKIRRIELRQKEWEKS